MKIESLSGYGNELKQTKFVATRGDPLEKQSEIRKESQEWLKFGSEKKYINDAIKRLKHAGDIFNRRLDFRIDEATKRIVVKVIDTETDKVIKEIPPEQLIKLAAKIQEMIGLLVDEER